VLQRSANKARTQAINQLRNLIVTAPDDLRGRLRNLSIKELLAVCSGFRIAVDDDSLNAITGSACVTWRSASCSSTPAESRPDAGWTASRRRSHQSCWPSTASARTLPPPCS